MIQFLTILSNCVQIWVEKSAQYFKTMFKKWSSRGQVGVSQGSPGGQVGSVIVFTVFETFLNGQTVFRYVSKRVRNTLKQCSKSGHQGARGHQGFSQGPAKGQPGAIGLFSYDQNFS